MADPHSRKEQQIHQSTTHPPWLQCSHRSHLIPAPHAGRSLPPRRSDPAQSCRRWALASWPPQARRRTAARWRDRHQDPSDLAPDAVTPRCSAQSNHHGKTLWPLMWMTPWGLSVNRPAEGLMVESQGHRSKPLTPTIATDQTRSIKPGSEWSTLNGTS